MKPEIKQRIEQINNGDVPDGYKKTEFGVFPFDWITDKKLKDIGSFDKGRGLPGDKMSDSGVPCVGYGDIYMKYDNFHFDKAQNFVDEDTASESLPIDKGTLLFTATGETAEEIGKCVCYNGDGIIYAGGDIITFKNNEVNPLFLAYQQYQSYSLAKKASFGQGHSVVHIHADNLEKLNVAYPPFQTEQEKIAEILMKWDEAIELYYKQIEKYELLKTVCLKKMFPKKKSKIPEIRFKGFTEAWEQRKLSEIYQNIGNAFVGTATPYYVEKGHFYLESNNIKDGQINHNTEIFINDEFYEKQKDKWLHTDDMVMVQSGHVGHSAVIPEELNNSAAHALIMFRNPTTKVNPYFLNYEYQTINAKKKIENITTGNTIKHILASDMQEFVVDVPSYEEQQQIGKYFQSLDNLITLHQRKIEIISKQRKVLQQYLLNGIVRVNDER